MSKTGVVTLVCIFSVAIITLMLVLGAVSISNKEVVIRNSYTAELDHNKMVKDKTWKVVRQKANILEKYAEDFDKVYTQIMEGRYGNSDSPRNALFLWIQEQNPNFSAEMYRDLGNAVEANSREFLEVQTKLRDIKREHDNLRTTIPSSFVVGGRKELEAVVIVSTHTSDVFRTKIDDDVELFDKKAEK